LAVNISTGAPAVVSGVGLLVGLLVAAAGTSEVATAVDALAAAVAAWTPTGWVFPCENTHAGTTIKQPVSTRITIHRFDKKAFILFFLESAPVTGAG
jgi:hypothetical protein